MSSESFSYSWQVSNYLLQSYFCIMKYNFYFYHKIFEVRSTVIVFCLRINHRRGVLWVFSPLHWEGKFSWCWTYNSPWPRLELRTKNSTVWHKRQTNFVPEILQGITKENCFLYIWKHSCRYVNLKRLVETVFSS